MSNEEQTYYSEEHPQGEVRKGNRGKIDVLIHREDSIGQKFIDDLNAHFGTDVFSQCSTMEEINGILTMLKEKQEEYESKPAPAGVVPLKTENKANVLPQEYDSAPQMVGTLQNVINDPKYSLEVKQQAKSALDRLLFLALRRPTSMPNTEIEQRLPETKEYLIKCGHCGAYIPQSEYKSHYNGHVREKQQGVP